MLYCHHLIGLCNERHCSSLAERDMSLPLLCWINEVRGADPVWSMISRPMHDDGLLVFSVSSHWELSVPLPTAYSTLSRLYKREVWWKREVSVVHTNSPSGYGGSNAICVLTCREEGHSAQAWHPCRIPNILKTIWNMMHHFEKNHL